jgi:flavin reductase (DIM6/NTAB) family NADH-FMN oxidoreductase RutF
MVNQDTFRSTTGTFATGVTIVTMNVNGDNHGMTVNSFASVSLNPPLVLYNADEATRSHDLTADAGHYAVNILAADQEWLSNRFAGEHKEMDDPFTDIEVRREETGAPIFENALSYIDCSLYDSHEAGDHTTYVGQVESLGVQRPNADPLTFYKANYGTVS